MWPQNITLVYFDGKADLDSVCSNSQGGGGGGVVMIYEQQLFS